MLPYYKKALAFLCCTAAVTGAPALGADKPAVEINLDVLNSLLLSTVQAPAPSQAYPKPVVGGADFLKGGVPQRAPAGAPYADLPAPPSPYYEPPAVQGGRAPAAPPAWQTPPGAAGQNTAMAAKLATESAAAAQAQAVVAQQAMQARVAQQMAAAGAGAAAPASPAPNLPKKGNIYTPENLETPSGNSWFDSSNGYRNAPPVIQRPGQGERYSFIGSDGQEGAAGDPAAETLPWKNKDAVRSKRPASIDAQRRAYGSVPGLSMQQTPFAGIPTGPTSGPAPVLGGLGGSRDPFAAARKSLASRPGVIAPAGGGPFSGIPGKSPLGLKGQAALAAAATKKQQQQQLASGVGKRIAPMPAGVTPTPQLKPDPSARLALAQDIVTAPLGDMNGGESEESARPEVKSPFAAKLAEDKKSAFAAKDESGDRKPGRDKGKNKDKDIEEDKKNKKDDNKFDKADHADKDKNKERFNTESEDGKGRSNKIESPNIPAAAQPEGKPGDSAKPEEGQINTLRDRIRALRLKREAGKAAEAEEASNGIPGVPFDESAVAPLAIPAVPQPETPVAPPAPVAAKPQQPVTPAAGFDVPAANKVPESPKAPEHKAPEPAPAPAVDPSLAALQGLAQADKAEKGGKKDEKKGDKKAPDAKPVAPAAPASSGGGSSAVNFPPGADALTDAQKAQIDAFVKSAQGGNGKINVVGYASAGGEDAKSPEYVSLKRVVAVRNYIMNKGIAHERIMIKAKGDKVDNPSQTDTVQLITGE